MDTLTFENNLLKEKKLTGCIQTPYLNYIG